MDVDGTEQRKELDTMLGEVGEILVDHFQGTLEDVLHHDWYLVFHERLIVVSKVSVISRRSHKGGRGCTTEYFERKGVQRTDSLVMIVDMTFRTSASLALGTFLL